MIVQLVCAALLGGVIGGAELAARYRDKPASAILSPSGLLYVFVNATAAVIALVAVAAARLRFGLPVDAPPASALVVQVLAAGIGSAAVFRASFTLAQDRGISLGPILLLHGLLKIVDGALERKRALSRLSHNDLVNLSFARDHAALAELCCHALPRFELAEAQRLGELAADLRARTDLTDADKLDCFGLELCRLVGERALRKAADRLRDRLSDQVPPVEPALEETDDDLWAEADQSSPAASQASSPAEERRARLARTAAVSPVPLIPEQDPGDRPDPAAREEDDRTSYGSQPVTGRLTRRSFRDS